MGVFQIEIIDYDVVNDQEVLRLIDSTVKTFLSTQPPHIRQYVDEIKNYVLMACWNNQKYYDPSRGKPVTFFRRRISGAIQDWLRENSPFSRSFHKNNPDVKMYVISGAGEPDGESVSVVDNLDSVRYSSIKECIGDGESEVDLSDFLNEKFNCRPRMLSIIKYKRLGYTNKEIGSMLGCSEATVCVMLQKIRKRICSLNEYDLPLAGVTYERVRRTKDAVCDQC